MKRTRINRIALSTLIAVLSLMLPSFARQASARPDSLLFLNVKGPQTQQPPRLLAPTNPLYVCWDLMYNNRGILHASRLRMTGYDGEMVTGYYNVAKNKTEFVKQTMQLGSSPQALIIKGSNPVEFGTNSPLRTYSPDNFAFQLHPVEGWKAVTVDNAYNRSLVDVQPCQG